MRASTAFAIERIVNSLFTADKFTEKDLPENARFVEDDMHFNLGDKFFVKDGTTLEIGSPGDLCH